MKVRKRHIKQKKKTSLKILEELIEVLNNKYKQNEKEIKR